MKANKKAAIELSAGTIVVIVLAMTMLILGMVFVRNIICSGIILTDQVSMAVENELKDLFGSRDMGVKCMGEEGKDVKLGSGGTRKIFCLINTDENEEYNFTIRIESLSEGVPTREVKKWLIDEGWEGSVTPGMTTAVVAVLNIPKKVSRTNLKLTIDELNKKTGSTKQTHISYLEVTYVGAVKGAIC